MHGLNYKLDRQPDHENDLYQMISFILLQRSLLTSILYYLKFSYTFLIATELFRSWVKYSKYLAILRAGHEPVISERQIHLF